MSNDDDERRKWAETFAAELDVAGLVDDLARPTMVWRLARGREVTRHRGGAAARRNAEASIRRVLLLYLTGQRDVLAEERRVRIERLRALTLHAALRAERRK